MSSALNPVDFPLHGSRLIEASAGTGKTWTIAALYLRLVLGHGAEAAFAAPLDPSSILVMTFTRAATRELSERIRARLLEAAQCFRGEREADSYDDLLRALRFDFAEGEARERAAYHLSLAASAMDDAAVFTIDAWCQRMLREHAFDSGSLFDEELLADEQSLYQDAVLDFWRREVYPLAGEALDVFLAQWKEPGDLALACRSLVERAERLGEPSTAPLAGLIPDYRKKERAELAALKAGWAQRSDEILGWFEKEKAGGQINGRKLQERYLMPWLDALKVWVNDPEALAPDLKTGWDRLSPEGIAEAWKGDAADLPGVFAELAALRSALDEREGIKPVLLRHASRSIAERMAQLKQAGHRFGFSDLLTRLRRALEGGNGAALRSRILAQYPVVLIDEFQDTSPEQYRIFDLLYRIADNDKTHGIFLIGDPKQSIYGFRGADIHSYLAARAATEGRHYRLATNFRSSRELVDAVNQIFLLAEKAGTGAFRFRAGKTNPLPFEAVAAQGRKDSLLIRGEAAGGLKLWCQADEPLGSADYLARLAAQCGEQIVSLLNDPAAGFAREEGEFARLSPSDLAVLVRDRSEAAAIRRALARRGVASVYLSDKDSVFESAEAKDVLRWLRAAASPLDARLAHAALATATLGLPLERLQRLASDDLSWDVELEALQGLHRIWQRQGVLAMLRRWVHRFALPSRLLAVQGGERVLTNVLHLAELLQEASLGQDGEQGLIRWFAEQMVEEGGGEADARVLRLESDAGLVRLVTVHKSKGLEYPIVFLPFALSARPVSPRNRSYLELSGRDGERRIDFRMGKATLAEADEARLQEDIRLIYVALTRARHALFLGLAEVSNQSRNNRLSQSALGYLLGGTQAQSLASVRIALDALARAGHAIAVESIPEPIACTLLAREDLRSPLIAAPDYQAQFERDWTIGSFSALTRQLASRIAPQDAREARLFEMADAEAPSTPLADQPWHLFPRGSQAGSFLHGELEWLAGEGFSAPEREHFSTRVAQRCIRSGWGHRATEVEAWLRAIVSTSLPPLGAALSQLRTTVPELEFWFPSERLEVQAFDALCREELLPGVLRTPLPERELHGMLKGYADLVFEHAGRYWVLDYKSNVLGGSDSAYHAEALAGAIAAHRYDVQGAIYMLALHRHLRVRLGDGYDPHRQLGGAIFLFLRGIAHPATHGCFLLPASPDFLSRLDALLAEKGTAL